MGNCSGSGYGCRKSARMIYMGSHEACYELLAGKPEWMDVYIVEG